MRVLAWLALMLCPITRAQFSTAQAVTPFSLWEAKLNATEIELREKIGVSECVERKETKETTCNATFDLAGAYIRAVLTFYQGKLADVSGAMARDDARTVLEVFSARFGTPASSDRTFGPWKWQSKNAPGSVFLELDGSVPDERIYIHDLFAESFCSARRAKAWDLSSTEWQQATKLWTETQEALKSKAFRKAHPHITAQSNDDAYYSLIIAIDKRSSAANSEALEVCREVASSSLGFFSLTLGTYSAELSRRRSDAIRAAAGVNK